MSECKERYFLSYRDKEWEVTKEEYIAAERAAGFRSKFGPNEVATGAFSSGGIRGRTRHDIRTDCKEMGGILVRFGLSTLPTRIWRIIKNAINN